MTTPHLTRPRLSLELARRTRALEIGDWRSVLAGPLPPGALDGTLEAARLATLQSLVADAMRRQAWTDVHGASRQLGVASELLPPGCSRVATNGVGRLAILTRAPTDAPGVLRSTWAVSTLVWREQRELEELRHLFLPGRPPADQLTDACVEQMRWVDQVPWMWTEHRHGDPVLTDCRRGDLLDRANALRRLAAASVGDLDPRTWAAVGRYPGLRARAMRRLAGTPLASWKSLGDLARDVPVRRGRVVARRNAVQWLEDLGYDGG